MNAWAQTKQVSGVVTDGTGETVIGASVLEKGTTNGTITDLDGKFILTVNENAVLQISYVGYTTQEVPVKGKTSFNITLKEDSEMLEEVVVVGY
ncbi:carboxypeptidase-like regulatory domain-containing protein, partial [Bacteroides sp. CAG:633]